VPHYFSYLLVKRVIDELLATVLGQPNDKCLN
jgi:hypothetical protein